MSEVNFTKLEKSLSRLKERHNDFVSMGNQNVPDYIAESVKESTIKRFDICYDMLVKHLKKFMEDELGIDEVKDFGTEIFRKAKESGIIDTEMQRQLNEYRKKRNSAAHNYAEEDAEQVLLIAGDFIQDASQIYEKMVTWK